MAWHIVRMSLSRSVAVIAAALIVLGTTACQSDNPQPTPSSSSAPGQLPEIPAPGDQTVNVQFGEKVRNFLVHAPATYDGKSALPLVVAMHSYPGDSAGIATTSALNAKADKENFLVVYPQGYAGGYNALICCGSEDDVGFIKTIIERMVSMWKADPKRIYATGISNGGDMSFKLAVELPDTFAAIAAVSGGFIGTKATDASYKAKSAVSVITFLGGKDRYYGQFDAGIKQWQERLSCTAGAPKAMAQEITLTTAKCADGSDLAVYRLPQMGHSWPGAQQGALADPVAGLNATDLVWDFFKSHTR